MNTKTKRKGTSRSRPPKSSRSMIIWPMRSRRKWAVRGRAAGDFTGALLFSFSEHAADLLLSWGKKACLGISAAVRKCRQRSTASSAGIRSKSAKSASVEEPLFKPIPKSDIQKVDFEQIAGLDEPKKIITQLAMDPLRYKSKYAVLDIKEGGGILLVGPPGNGKSYLIKAAANMAGMVVFEITPVDIIKANQSASLIRITELFNTVRSYPRVLIALNEFEGIARKSSSSIISTVNSQLLIETSGFLADKDKGTLLMIGTSNVPEIMRSALLRSGRFQVVFVGVPEFNARRQILVNSLKSLRSPVLNDIDYDSIADRTRLFSGADLVDGLIEKAKLNTLERSKDLPGNHVYPVSMVDFEVALAGMKPSIGEQGLSKWYDDLSVIT